MISIDFDAARMISDYIIDSSNSLDKILSDCNSAISPINSLPSRFFNSTISIHNSMKVSTSNICDQVSIFSYAFDKSINDYYCMENDISQDRETESIKNVFDNSSETYVWGYKESNSTIKKVDETKLQELLLSSGARETQDNTYELNIDGIVYKYNTKNRKLYVGNNSFRCDFYVSGDYNSNKEISNTVTLLGGTGERGSGPIGDGKVENNIAIGSSGLLIVPFSGDANQKLSSDAVIKSNNFGEKVFNASNDVTRSIVGFSEGSRVASETISENPNIYDNVVFVNGSTRYNSDSTNSFIRNGNYEGFKNTNVYYMITRNGWDEKSVTLSVNDLINNGVDPSDITLISNDTRITDGVNTSINIVDSMPSSENGSFFGHGAGGWDILNNSEIIDYLSLVGKGGRNG